MARPKKDITETVQKEHPEFADTVAGMSVDELNAKVAELAKYGEEIESAKESNESLKMLKDQLKEMTGPYTDAKKAIRMKTKYVISLLKEKGGA